MATGQYGSAEEVVLFALQRLSKIMNRIGLTMIVGGILLTTGVFGFFVIVVELPGIHDWLAMEVNFVLSHGWEILYASLAVGIVMCIFGSYVIVHKSTHRILVFFTAIAAMIFLAVVEIFVSFVLHGFEGVF